MEVNITKIDIVVGSVNLTVNDKNMTVFIHPSGEIDWEGPELTDDEHDAVMDTILNNERIQAAFPMED